jgi:hypothetical protein
VPIDPNEKPKVRKESMRAPRREKRPTSDQPTAAEVAAEAASIYPDTFETPPSPDEIAAEAYAIYQSRGGAHGRHQDDWYEAEQRLKERRQPKK